MRRSNWKRRLVVVAAFVLGLLAGLAVSMGLPEQYAPARGLAMFGTMSIVSAGLVFLAVRVFKIGEE